MADEIEEIEGSDLGAIIANEIRSAKRYVDSELADKRARNIEYLAGEMNDLPPAPNRSTVVSRDLSDTVSWILPGLIRVFTASDIMAEYEPATEKDVEFARQATDYVNYIFFKDNEGYRTLYNAMHDAVATAGNGIVCHYWDPTPETEISKHTRLTDMQIAQLQEDEGVEIVAANQNEEPDTVVMPDPQTGQDVEMQVPTYDIKVRRTKSRGRLKVYAGKPENFFLDPEAVTIEDARFVAYLHDNKTRSDLVEMGFDRDVVEELAADSVTFDSEESLARERDMVVFRSDVLKSTQLIDLYECYIKADIDGDGIAEMVQVWYAGDAGAGKVLAYEEWEDDIPFTDIPCYPIPHRWDADSAADRLKDIQKIKTVLLRQALDNIYASNLPMLEAEAGTVLNPDMLAAPKFGGTIWRKPGSQPIAAFAIPFVADKSFSAMDYMDQVIAKRTGVSRTTMALDPEALQNQTATASQNQRDAGYSQIELIARNMAELGWRRVFRHMLRLVVKHQDRPRTIRLRDKFIEMDPRSWNAGMDVTVNVGLGTGSRDRDMAMLKLVLDTQLAMADRFAQTGFSEEALEMVPKIVNTLTKLAESAGLKNPEAYYPEFDEQKIAMMKQRAAEAAQQPSESEKIEQAKIEAQREIETLKAQGNAIKEQAQLEADLKVKEAERQNAAMIGAEEIASTERIKAAELAFRREELQVKTALEYQKMRNAAEMAAQKAKAQPQAAE